MRFTPTNNRVLVEPLTEQHSRIGSIHIPEAYRETRPTEGIVIALGTKGPFEVKVGDRIVMEQHRGTDVKIHHAMFKILETKDILATIE